MRAWIARRARIQARQTEALRPSRRSAWPIPRCPICRSRRDRRSRSPSISGRSTKDKEPVPRPTGDSAAAARCMISDRHGEPTSDEISRAGIEDDACSPISRRR